MPSEMHTRQDQFPRNLSSQDQMVLCSLDAIAQVHRKRLRDRIPRICRSLERRAINRELKVYSCRGAIVEDLFAESRSFFGLRLCRTLDWRGCGRHALPWFSFGIPQTRV